MPIVAKTADVVYGDRELLRAALAMMGKFADKRLSMADCLSFVLIERLALDGALTFDGDFAACRFEGYPGARGR